MSLSHSVVAPGVFELPLFTPEECHSIIDRAEHINVWSRANVANYFDLDQVDEELTVKGFVDLKARDAYVTGAAIIPDDVALFENRVLDRCSKTVKTEWNISLNEVSGTQLVKYVPGSHIRTHTDSGTKYSRRVMSVVAYLNDEYEGGHLSFPSLSFQIKPHTGSAIIFPSDYPHSVRVISAGLRYAFVTFMTIDKYPVWLE